ncbi:hypothetical protein AKJ16_DCAP26774 [Drosera capensis]
MLGMSSSNLSTNFTMISSMFRSRDSKDVKASFDFAIPLRAVTFATFASSPNSVTLLGSAILFLLNRTLIPLSRSRISALIPLVTRIELNYVVMLKIDPVTMCAHFPILG